MSTNNSIRKEVKKLYVSNSDGIYETDMFLKS